MHDPAGDLRWATPDDAAAVGVLLHDFNVEFGVPSPGPDVLTPRLRRLLADTPGGAPSTVALLAGDVPFAVALVTLRTNVWFDGPVALIDELYVEPNWRNRGVGTAMVAAIRDFATQQGVGLVEVNVDEDDVDARRFYVRHGFSAVDPDSGCPAYYYSMVV